MIPRKIPKSYECNFLGRHTSLTRYLITGLFNDPRWGLQQNLSKAKRWRNCYLHSMPGRDCRSVCVCVHFFFFLPLLLQCWFRSRMSWWWSCPTKLVKQTLGEAGGKRSNVYSSRLKVFCVFRTVSTTMTWTVDKILSTDNPSLHRSRLGQSTRGTLRDSGQSGSIRNRRLEVPHLFD